MLETTFTAAEFAQATGGEWVGDLSAFPERAGFFSDTRLDGKNKLFFGKIRVIF